MMDGMPDQPVTSQAPATTEAPTQLPSQATSFDLHSFLREQVGGVVNKVNPDGSAQVIMPNGMAQRFNTSQFLRDHGYDPQKVKVQYNSPDTALNENPLGFADGLNFLMASDKGRMEGLQNRFGKENVLPDAEGGALVNDGGVWKKARPNFISQLISNSPEMMGGVEGGEYGAALGSSLGPVGSAVGGVAGMAIGAALAHVVKTEGVEALNMRSGLDAKEAMGIFGKEAVNNLIWGSVLGGASAGATGVAKKAFSLFDKEAMATIGEKLLPGTFRMDWRTVVRSAEDAEAVKSNIETMAAWSKDAATKIAPGVDPMTSRMTSLTKNFMTTAKEGAENGYNTAMDLLGQSGATKNATISTVEATNNLKTALSKLGVIGENKTTGEWFVHNDPAIAAKNGDILQIFDSGDIATLNKILKQSETTSGELKFDQVRSLQKGIDNLLESTGYYKGGDSAISNAARRTLMGYRADLANATKKGLDQFQVFNPLEGNSVSAGKFFAEAQGKYSGFREVYDNFALPSKFGGDIGQVRATIDKMLGPKGSSLEDAFSKLSQVSGNDAINTLQKLQQLRAGRELSAQYTKTPGFLNTARETVLGGPRDWANRVGSMTQMQEAWNNQVAARMPVTGPQKTTVESTARFADWLNNLTGSEKTALVTNPVALRQVWNSVQAAPMMHQQGVSQLMGVANQKVNGQ